MSTSVLNQGNEPVPAQPSASDIDSLIEMLGLSQLQQHFMRSRWLDQVNWMEGKAKQAQKRYYALRLTAIIGGVIVPILISLNFTNPKVAEIIHLLSIILSGVVAICSAVEEFFHYGERWQHYRRTVESLKIQGWQFSQLSGLYSGFESHQQAFPRFVLQVEDILQRDVEAYISKVVQEKQDDKKEEEKSESI